MQYRIIFGYFVVFKNIQHTNLSPEYCTCGSILHKLNPLDLANLSFHCCSMQAVAIFNWILSHVCAPHIFALYLFNQHFKQNGIICVQCTTPFCTVISKWIENVLCIRNPLVRNRIARLQCRFYSRMWLRILQIQFANKYLATCIV